LSCQRCANLDAAVKVLEDTLEELKSSTAEVKGFDSVRASIQVQGFTLALGILKRCALTEPEAVVRPIR